jgi:hypothetical protein
MKNTIRNTPTHRICPTCKGDGLVEVRPSSLCVPGEEYDAQCPRADCYDGWIRTRDEDPLEQLQLARKRYRQGWPNYAYAGKRYGEIRQRVVSPVMLPLDRRPMLDELYANLQCALERAA